MEIEGAVDEDLWKIMNVMREASRCGNPEYYLMDDAQFVSRHFSDEGFILLCKESKRAAGFLIVRIPGQSEDNLGRDVGINEHELNYVAHMESIAVLPKFRGNGIQRQLIKEAEARLEAQEMRWCMATVHPDNVYSLDNFLKLGYHVEGLKKKYGGKLRCIVKKNL